MRAIKKQVTLKRIIIISVFVIFIFNYIKQEGTIKKIKQEIITSQSQLEEIKLKNSELQSDLEKVYSDEYIEKLARERLGQIRDGEKVVNSQKQN